MAEWVEDWTDSAREEYLDALRYYRAIDQRLADDLRTRVERAMGIVLLNRESASPYLSGTRRKLLKQFPYAIVYQLNEARLIVSVVAFTHLHRKPGYWIER